MDYIFLPDHENKYNHLYRKYVTLFLLQIEEGPQTFNDI